MGQSQTMRGLINLFEIGRISDIYWFNARTGEVYPCGDHGEAIEKAYMSFTNTLDICSLI